MERFRNIQAEVGKTTYEGNLKIEVQKTEQPFNGASDTALHEAKHVVAGIDDGAQVNKVSVVPGPGYLGVTEFNRFTDAGAAAPHADGHSGTSWDVSLIHAHGGSLMSASIRGRESIIRKSKHVQKVAEALDRQGTLSGPDVVRIYRELEKGEEIRINISSNGETESFTTRTPDQFVSIPNDKIPFSS